MGLIERIFRKIHHFIINLRGDILRDAVCHTSGHALLRISIDEIRPLLFHHGLLFLTHGTAHEIASPKRIAAQITHDLHYLLLINNTAVGRRQNRLQLRTQIGNCSKIALSLNIFRDKVHRSRTVQGNPGNNIFKVLWLQFLHEVLHSCTFQLEHAICFAGSDGCQNLFIIKINLIKINLFSGTLPYKLHGITQHREGSKSQEVHLQKSELFDRRHRKLGCDGTVRSP